MFVVSTSATYNANTDAADLVSGVCVVGIVYDDWI